jgi:hypothetical protein
VEIEQRIKIEQSLLKINMFRVQTAWTDWLGSGFDREKLKWLVNYASDRRLTEIEFHPEINVDTLVQHSHLCQIPKLLAPEIGIAAVEQWVLEWDELLKLAKLSIGRKFLSATLAYKREPAKLPRILLGVPQEQRPLLSYLLDGNYWEDSTAFEKYFCED